MRPIMLMYAPKTWNKSRIGSLFLERREIVSDKDYTPLSVTKNGILPQIEGVAKTDNNDARKLVRKGDIVINSRSDRKGSSGLSNLDGSISVINTVLIPLKGNGRFYHYLFRSGAFQEEFFRYGHGIVDDLWTTRFNDMKGISIAFPDEEIQANIASFLDRETAKAGALIAKYERLIGLLEEKRVALITQTVTRGLDTSVLMKDSGVEWIGEIPQRWRIVPLQRLTPDERPIVYGIVLPGPNVDDGIMIVKGGDVKPGRLNPETLKKTTFEIESGYARSRLKAGDLVYAIRGGIGDVEIVPKEIEGANITQDAARISPRRDVLTKWLRYAMESRSVFGQLEQSATGATIRGINIWSLRRAKIPVPPSAEQNAIANHIDSQIGALETLVTHAQKAIGLMREHRSALVTDAVTGQIDVRTYKAKDLEEVVA